VSITFPGILAVPSKDTRCKSLLVNCTDFLAENILIVKNMPRQSIFILIFVFLLTYPNGGNAAFKEKDRREACYELADVSKFFFCSLKNGGPRFMIYNPTPPPLNTTA